MTESTDHDAHGHDGGHGDPDPEIQISPIAKTMVALLVTMLVFAILMIPLVRGIDEYVEGKVPDEDSVSLARPSGPLLQPHPPSDMKKLRDHEEAVLSHYGWTDQSSGLARVPLSRAKEMILQQGLGPVGVAPEVTAP